jgi:hypothetical protein
MKVLMGKPSSNEGFPIAMFDYQRVRWRWLVDEKKHIHHWVRVAAGFRKDLSIASWGTKKNQVTDMFG